jgi:hypothetical protein
MPLFGGSKIIPSFGCPKLDGSEEPELHLYPLRDPFNTIFTISTSHCLKLSKKRSNKSAVDVTYGLSGY